MSQLRPSHLCDQLIVGWSNAECMEMLQLGVAGETEDTEGSGPPPPLQLWFLGVLRYSPGPARPGPAPGAKMETSPPAKSMSWPAAAGLPEPLPGPPLVNRALPLGAVTAQQGQGGQPRGSGVEEWPGQWLNVLELSSPGCEPLPYSVTLGQRLDLSDPQVSHLPSEHRAMWGRGHCLELPGGGHPRR